MITGSHDGKVVQASSTISESKFFDYLVRNPYEFNPNLPKTSWDFDWDKRDPASLIPPPKSPIMTEDEVKKHEQKVIKARPTATRHLLLIRHGQYNLNGVTDEEKTLTPMVSCFSRLFYPSSRKIT